MNYTAPVGRCGRSTARRPSDDKPAGLAKDLAHFAPAAHAAPAPAVMEARRI